MDDRFNNAPVFSSGHGPRMPQVPQAHSHPYLTNSSFNSQVLPPLSSKSTDRHFANGLTSQASQPPPHASYSIASDSSQHGQDFTRYHSSPSSFSQQPQQYGMRPGYPSQSGPFQSPQSSDAAHSRLPDLLPMPGGSSNSYGISYSYPSSSQSMTTSLSTIEPDRDSRPTHVVGSQGRRGILPSADGRPVASQRPETPTNSKSAAIPPKDIDGKYPCPHCAKTYLHAKHLKRHLLRHTGDRPYMCILCKDTFSRSDILKRHFQKCSIRRGNPTGATHLSSSQAHVRKPQAVGKKGSVSDADGRSGLDPAANNLASSREISSNDTSLTGLGISDYGAAAYQSTPGSRSNSISRSSTGVDYGYRHGLNGSGPNGLTSQNYSFPSEHVSPTSLSTNIVLTALDRKPQRHSGHSTQVIIRSPEGLTLEAPGVIDPPTHFDLRSEQCASPLHEPNAFDWSDPYQQGARDGHVSLDFPSATYEHSSLSPGDVESETPYKYLFENRDAILSGMYPQSSPPLEEIPEHYHFWHFDDNHLDSYESMSIRLTAFCFGDSYDTETRSDEHEHLKSFLSSANLIHFLKLYSHFQGHWPLIHIPTFNPFVAYDGLLLVLICLGAVYSDRIDLPHVRALMEHVTRAMQRSSRLLHLLDPRRPHSNLNEVESEYAFQELQAWTFLQSLSAWHGNAEQRSKGRKDLRRLALLVRKLELLEPCKSGGPFYSILHQPSPQYEETCMDPYLVNRWDWVAWVQQEKRCRFIHHLYLMDAAIVIFFNSPPNFQYHEIQVPLPADDAAWEARSAQECAAALGLQAPHAQAGNTTGSLRKKQLELAVAMNCLFHPEYEFEPRATNVYGKFILIHALQVRIWNLQRHLLRGPAFPIPSDNAPTGRYEDRPPRGSASGHTSNSSSGHGSPNETPGSQSPHTHQLLLAVNHALQKWKKIWDKDMALQYPPTSSSPFSSPTKRLGFCRDGIHFYWLARLWLRSPHSADINALPDQRFLQSMNELKRVRHWVASDNATRGEEIGSVGEIAESYGVEDLLLDMKLLFAPMRDLDREGVDSIGGL